MKILIKNIFLKQILNIQNIYIICIDRDLSFLLERMKIKICNKLVCNLHDKKEYAVHIRALKQPLNHGLILKKVYRVIQFNKEAWLKPQIEMNTKLRIF